MIISDDEGDVSVISPISDPKILIQNHPQMKSEKVMNPALSQRIRLRVGSTN